MAELKPHTMSTAYESPYGRMCPATMKNTYTPNKDTPKFMSNFPLVELRSFLKWESDGYIVQHKNTAAEFLSYFANM